MQKIFDYNELLFMIDALNGVICSPETFAANLWGWVPYAGEIVAKIEPNIMIGKVSRLSPLELSTLHAQVARFWEGRSSIPDIRSRMEEIGLLDWEVLPGKQ